MLECLLTCGKGSRSHPRQDLFAERPRVDVVGQDEAIHLEALATLGEEGRDALGGSEHHIRAVVERLIAEPGFFGDGARPIPYLVDRGTPRDS